MDKRRIEEKAITALKSILLQSPFLEPYIESNDKTPSWDGTVFVYHNEDHNKANLIARVPVQVKGTERTFSKTATFPFSTADLRNYYNDGGCLLFLVSGITSTNTGTIYYLDLQVFDLEKLLKNASHKKTISIKMEVFPTDNETEIVTIFANCAENRKKQSSFIGKELFDLDQLLSSGRSLSSLSLSTTCLGSGPDDVGRFISSHQTYVYAKAEGIDIDIPVEKTSNLIVTRAINEKVIVKGKVYYPNYIIEYKNGIPTICIGKSISIIVDDQKRSLTIHFKPTGTLREQILDASYFIAMVESQEVELNNTRVPLNCREVDLVQYKKALKDYQDIQKVLDYFGVTEDLDVESLSEKDRQNLKSLVEAIVHNKRLKLPKANGPVICGPYDVGNLSIWIWAIKQDSGDYRIENFFSNHTISLFSKDDEELNHPIPVSQYLLLDKNAFLYASNIDFESIEKSIAIMNHHPDILDSTNRLLLNILLAYDLQKTKDMRLLDLADAICKWISDDSDIVVPVYRLNQLQIKKRRAPLSNRDRIELIKLAEEGNKSEIRCGAFLLLDDSVEAQKCFDQLTKAEQEDFLTYPICSFGSLSIKNEKR